MSFDGLGFWFVFGPNLQVAYGDPLQLNDGQPHQAFGCPSYRSAPTSKLVVVVVICLRHMHGVRGMLRRSIDGINL